MGNINSNQFIITIADDDFNKALNNLCNAAPKYGVNVVHIHNMKDTFKRNGIEFDKDYCIVELCSPEISFKALSLDLRLGNFMPKHIIVFKDHDGKNKYMMMKSDSDSLDVLFPDINVRELTQEVMQYWEKLMYDAKGQKNEL